MDPVIALVQGLLADASVTGAPAGSSPTVGENVFDFEIPEGLEETGEMPLPSIVIRPNLGPGGPNQLYLNENRMQVLCYGPTPHLAYVVYLAVSQSFKDWISRTYAQTNIKTVNAQTGAATFRDSNEYVSWAYNISQWLVTASDMTVA